MTRLARVVPWAALIVVCALAGFSLHRWLEARRHDGPGASNTAPPTGPLEAAAPSPTAIPKTRPLFSLPDLEGRPRSISEWDGKSLIINFWATWCEPCRREIPLLRKLNATRGGQGFQVLGIAVDRRPAVLDYVRQAGIDYPTLIGEQEALDVAARFGVEELGLPFTVFTDKQGRIVTLHMGQLKERDADAILDTVAALDRGALPFEQAKQAIRQAIAGR